MGKLKDKQVVNAKPGTHGDGDGLYLRVKPTGRRSWILRVQHMGKREDIGLGSYPLVTLAKAREEALRYRRVAKEGGNIRQTRKADRTPAPVIPTFAEAVKKAHASKTEGLSDKTRAAFKASLDLHIVPKLGDKPVNEIGISDVIAALAPTWTTKPALAQKLRHWTLQVLNFAAAQEWRSTPAPTAAEIRSGLANRPQGKNFASVPFEEVPAFVSGELAKEATAGRLALLFTILTAARSGETRSARWEHFDIEAREWNRPADLMKARQAHTVTLNDAALSILKQAKELFGDTGLVFPGRKAGSQLSDMTLSKVLKAAGRTETVHGFRSTFRVWAVRKMPTVSADAAEMALAHRVGTATTRAYQRDDLREQRRPLLDAWGRYVAPSLSGHTDNIINLARAG
ncbi:hypothetical protein ASE67_10190 [Sphingomonas sp. Leaf23]|uniref:tyrosine-type recombinase/integrase n=1 Tax=Sphingomonas sp. Leaf23 TaxID=1735689 RepID=UPI0006F398FA|nr:site-specific integrase [Sphingomonas sp. Leaf23]KQM86209.1 hypothetical protein ASE67_10190 [Sphingomonas sp. Leaf23]